MKPSLHHYWFQSRALYDLLRARFGWTPGIQLEQLEVATAVARRFHVSLRAATIRLIEAKAAGWDLYRTIPKTSDDKTGGGPPAEPRYRAKIRQEQYGSRATSMFVRALEADVLGWSDVLTYLDVADKDLEQIQSAAHS